MTRSILRVLYIGLSVALLATAACNGGSATGDASQTSGPDGSGGRNAGAGGATGSGGAKGTGGTGGQGGSCAACANANVTACPADVATSLSICQSAGLTCCADGIQYTCSLCFAESCHWSRACPTTTTTTGTGGTSGAATACSSCNFATQYCSVTVGGPVGNPPSYQCVSLPAGCGSSPTCACLQGVACASQCTQSDGGLTATCFAP